MPMSSPSGDNDNDNSSLRPAYTLTACIRCRERKSRCDASLPRCTQCEKSGQSHCEYWDAAKRKRLPRSHIVRLRNEVDRLEAALAQYDIHDDVEPEDEVLVRDAAVVSIKETSERKFLGSSSGIYMTRLVVRLAKQALGAKSVSNVISAERLRSVSARNTQEESLPTSRIFQEQYPVLSSYATTNLPDRPLCDMIMQLYNIKVQSMYPLFHEPSLPLLFEEVLTGTRDAAKNFIVRVIIAIGLQRLERKWAGLADSYYLGALMYFEEVVRAMNLQTLQCFILIAQYSLITPTRTAAWYISGLGIRLAQQLGLAEERTIVLDHETGRPASPLEVDLKRRAFFAIWSVDLGLAHSLGRPSALAADQDHIDVQYFEKVDDEYITHAGVKAAPLSMRKWIAVHFYDMRLLQLEIRRTLYLQKRPTPTSDADEWFQSMERKMEKWASSSPIDDAGSGFSKSWFANRLGIITIMLYRPSPQIPRPSAQAAIRCYDACEANIHIHRTEVRTGSVETTWPWASAVFMALNTMLWSLSYIEVRQRKTREEVKGHLETGIETVVLGSDRWPGAAAAAAHLYGPLVDAILQLYDREGDVYTHSSPSDSDRDPRSASQSPNFGALALPAYHLTSKQESIDSSGMHSRPPTSYQPILPSNGVPHAPRVSASSISSTSTAASPRSTPTTTANNTTATNATANAFHAQYTNIAAPASTTLAPPAQFNPLPSTYGHYDQWQFSPPTVAGAADVAGQHASSLESQWPDYDENCWDEFEGYGDSINEAQQSQLLRELEMDGGVDQIETIVQQTNRFWSQFSDPMSMTRDGNGAGEEA